MHKSAQGCAATHYPGKRSGEFAPSRKGMNTSRHFVINPLQGMGRWLYGCPRVAAGPQPWADLCIPFGEIVGLCGRSPNCPRLNATFAFNRGYQKCPNSCSAFSRLIKVRKQSETQSASEMEEFRKCIYEIEYLRIRLWDQATSAHPALFSCKHFAVCVSRDCFAATRSPSAFGLGPSKRQTLTTGPPARLAAVSV